MAVDLSKEFERLFPICRSITGRGFRESLDILRQTIPLEVNAVETGRKVLDWEVPPEWHLKRAQLFDPNGHCILDTNNSNLHVLNFSEPFSGEVSLHELQQHLFSDPNLRDATPYVTSYYNRRWGLCMPHRQRENLQEGTYRVEIDTVIEPGVLNYGTAELAGESDEIVLISTYLCHPSLANNELSGPLVMLKIWEALAARECRRFTYRFVVLPETIGSITFLSEAGVELKEKLAAGVVLTCLGGPNAAVSFKLSRRDWVGEPSKIDILARHLAVQSDRFEVREFTPTSGSDERQYCSPGFNLPVIQAAKTIYGEYPGYHSSADDLEFMTIDALEKSASDVLAMLDAFEVADLRFSNTSPFGEPQLGRRNLYPSVNSPMSRALSNDQQLDGRETLNNLLNLLSLADGSRTMLEIAEHMAKPLSEFASLAKFLEQEGLLLDTES